MGLHGIHPGSQKGALQKFEEQQLQQQLRQQRKTLDKKADEVSVWPVSILESQQLAVFGMGHSVVHTGGKSR